MAYQTEGEVIRILEARDFPGLSDDDLRSMVDGPDAYEALLMVRDRTFLSLIVRLTGEDVADQLHISEP
jgi:hypothetical protein